MKLHTDPATAALNTVTAYGDGYIEVNQVRFSSSVAFGPEGEVTTWPVQSPADITSALLRQAAGMVEPVRDPLAFLDEPEAAPGRPANAPEVLLVGTGARQRFLRPEVLRPLLAIGVGVEVMDTHAASRTYNILMAEGRRVVVAPHPPNGDSPNDAEHRQTRPAVHGREHHRPDQPGAVPGPRCGPVLLPQGQHPWLHH